jgi:integrase
MQLVQWPIADADLLPEQAHAEVYRYAARAPQTWARYQSSIKAWVAYARAQGWPDASVSVSRVCAFLANLAGSGKAVSSVNVARAALRVLCRYSGWPDVCDDPQVVEVCRGIARTHGIAPRKQAADLTVDQMRSILQACKGDRLQDLRDQALLAVWWLSACRGSEISALNLQDLQWREAGVVLTLRRSKTDQVGRGREVPVPAGPATANLRIWVAVLAGRDITSGPLWRSVDGKNVRLSANACVEILQRRAKKAGITGLTGHSIRRGHVTAATLLGVPLQAIAKQTGHKRLDTVIRYVESARLFDDAPARGLL